MNETQTHFVAGCPYCSTHLRIRRGFAGQHVQCKHCNETFVAKETDEPATGPSGESDPVHPLPPLSQPERVVVSCPNCHTALSIRRVYLGRQVRCKKCDETFLASDLASNALASESGHDRNGKDTDRSALQAEVDRLLSENSRLRDERTTLATDRDRVSRAFEQLTAEFDRREREADRVRGELERATTDLDAIRAHLGEIEPASVRPLFEERASLVAEIDRLRDAIQISSDERSEGERTAAERDRHREEERIATRAELDRLAGLLEQSEAELETARAERDRLGTDRGRAADEAERFRIEGDRLRSEVEGLRRVLEDAEQGRRDEVGRLDAELAAVAEQRRQLHEHHETLDQFCKALRERNQELQAELDQLRWPLPAPDSQGELQIAHHEIESLKRKLDLADRLQREMAGILGGMGIKVRQI